MSSAANGIGISRLGQIHIPAQDAERATAFYKDTLGLPLLFTANNMAFFDCGGVRLMISRPEAPGEHKTGSILYFAVPDIVAAHQKLRDAGVRIEAEPRKIAEMPTHDLWMTFFRDSEDNLVALMSEVRRA
jgi:methylmalonyl-CoA/ethylmalonyl-CoA epimerase